uniref:Peroxisomal membrane protein PEX14 n=1 Tax=Globodera rostochiensis TaxID=31243 RepID=A0A914HVW1_GLORO
MPLSSAADPGPTSPLPPSPIRSEMVGAAKQFLTNPRVRNTPLEEQTEFLRAKGLTEAEIQNAMRSTEVTLAQSARAQMPSTSSSPLLSLPPASRTSTGQSIVDLARSALVFGTAGYMVYRFVRSWVLPHLLNVPDPAEERMQRLEEQVGRLSESSRCIAESVTQTLAAVTEQNEQLSRTMMLVRAEGEPVSPTSIVSMPKLELSTVQNGQNSNNTKGKIAASSLAKEENGEEAEEGGEGQRRNREVISASTGSPV